MKLKDVSFELAGISMTKLHKISRTLRTPQKEVSQFQISEIYIFDENQMINFHMGFTRKLLFFSLDLYESPLSAYFCKKKNKIFSSQFAKKMGTPDLSSLGVSCTLQLHELCRLHD